MKAHPKFSFLICPDSQILRNQVNALLAQYPPGTGEWQKKVYWEDEEPTTAFWNQFSQSQLFGTCTYMLLHHLEDWPQAILKKLDKVLLASVPTTWPILLLESPWITGTKKAPPSPKVPAVITHWKSYALADKNGWIWKHEGITEKTVSKYIQDRCADLKLNLPHNLLSNLKQEIALDANAIENELNKYALYYSTTESQKKETQIGTARDQEINIFGCITDLERGQSNHVLQTLLSQKDADKQYFVLASLLDRELRILWQLKTGIQVSLYSSILQTKQNLARKMSFQALARGMTILLETEWNIKQGVIDAAQGLERMVISLGNLFQQSIR